MDEAVPGGAGAGFGSSSKSFSARFGGKGLKKSFDMDSKGIDAASDSLKKLNVQLLAVKTTLASLTAMNGSVAKLMSSMGGVSGTTNGTSGTAPIASGGFSGGSSGVPSIGGGGGGMGSGGTSSGYSFTGGGGNGNPGMFTPSFKSDSIGGIVETVGNMMLMPVQFARNRFEENRSASMKMSQFLGSASMRSGSSIEDLVGMMGKKMPMRGSLDEMMGAVNNASRFGFSITDNNSRSGGFFEASRQLQELNPSASASQITGNLGSFMGNSTAVQKSVLFSGGAFSLQGAGGKTKSIQEWAVGLLKFFEGQRPGADRGKPFSRVQLETQQFPGSNMNAWFQMNQVPEYMVDAFWQYALAARGSTADQSFSDLVSGTKGMDLSFERLKGLSAQTRRDLSFTSASSSRGGSTNYKDYGSREKADAVFQAKLGANLDKGLASFMDSLGIGNMIGNIPTPIADMLYQFLQSAPSVAGQAVTAISEIIPGDTPAFSADAPIGDTGYSPLGNTNLNGMTPGMQQKVGAMMKANPRLKITSGYRDGGTQDRLHRRGVGRVAPNGKSSHTRGLAADLGPTSEHAWIAKNAGKFGLESGAGHGEPWHVGAPGTVPKMKVGDPMGASYPIGDSFLSGIPIIGPVADAVQGAVGGVADAVSGVVGGVLDTAQFVADYGGKLLNTAKLGLKAPSYIGQFIDSLTSGGAGLGELGKNIGNDINDTILGDLLKGLLASVSGGGGVIPGFGPAAGGSGGSAAGGSGGSGSGGNFTGRPSGAAPYGSGGASGGAVRSTGGSGGIQNLIAKYRLPNVPSAQVGPVMQDRMRTTLQAAAGAGFTGDDLVMITALAGKESGWNPMAYNGTGPDNSYGLFQINMKGSLGPARRKQYGLSSNEDLFDPNVSARVAKKIYGNGNVQPWGLETASDQNRAATAKYLQPVYDTAKSMGYVGDTYGGGAASGGSSSMTVAPRTYNSSSSAPTYVQVHAPITVQSNNRSSGDMQMLASVLAENLASSVRKELAR